MADNGRPLSLHSRMLADLEARIVSGEWAPGTRIPFEHELTVTYGCSRMTVNKVMTELVKAGLIERRRRAGSFVRQPRSEAAVMEIRQIEAEVAALGLKWRLDVLERRERLLDATDTRRTGMPAGAAVLELVCRHHAGAGVFCIEERLIDLAVVPQVRDVVFTDEAPGSWLMAHVPWTVAEHQIAAAPARGQMATWLSIPAGTACLVVERRTWRVEEPVTYARFTYPGEQQRLVARFSPAHGGRGDG